MSWNVYWLTICHMLIGNIDNFVCDVLVSVTAWNCFIWWVYACWRKEKVLFSNISGLCHSINFCPCHFSVSNQEKKN